MPKKVLDVGNCGPDHSAIRGLIERNFDADVTQAHGLEDTMELMQQSTFDLVLVNRKLDQDYSDGLRIIEEIKLDDGLRTVPVMLITNFEEHQELARKAGAETGFGKLSLDNPATIDHLAQWLS